MTITLHSFLPTNGDSRSDLNLGAVGLDEFVLSGYPHLEEVYAFGEGVMPILAGRGLFAIPGLRPR